MGSDVRARFSLEDESSASFGVCGCFFTPRAVRRSGPPSVERFPRQKRPRLPAGRVHQRLGGGLPPGFSLSPSLLAEDSHASRETADVTKYTLQLSRLTPEGSLHVDRRNSENVLSA